jgi:hypothetical protein
MAEQASRLEAGKWEDARGQVLPGGREYDSDEEERELESGELDQRDQAYGGYGDGPGGDEREEESDDSKAILEDVVCPVIDSVSFLSCSVLVYA